MRMVMALPTAVFAVAAATSAMAQQGDATVGSYLCQFASKCDDAATSTTTEPAPAASPRERTSQTRGFHIAGGAYTAPAAAAPAAPASSATSGRRGRFAVAHPTPAAGRRVNLMLNFDYNSDQMTPGAQAKATVFAQALMTPELRDKRFLIEGHTDSRGSRDANVDLSRRRAKSVADFLIAQGVSARNIQVRGVGPDGPLPGVSASAEGNRRVEAILLP